jgi:hypothetical protein
MIRFMWYSKKIIIYLETASQNREGWHWQRTLLSPEKKYEQCVCLGIHSTQKPAALAGCFQFEPDWKIFQNSLHLKQMRRT